MNDLSDALGDPRAVTDRLLIDYRRTDRESRAAAKETPVITSPSTKSAPSPPATPAGTTGIGTGHPGALLTQSDVAGSIGEPVSAGVQSSARGAGLCAYSSVSGIGDQASAVFSQTGEGYPALVVRKGAIGFEVSFHGSKVLALPDRGLAKEEALATLILPRL